MLFDAINLFERYPFFSDYFKDFTHLAFVRLNRNGLTDTGVPREVFNISTLLDLQLSHNKLASIPVISSHLVNLHLNNNNIESESAMQCNAELAKMNMPSINWISDYSVSECSVGVY